MITVGYWDQSYPEKRNILHVKENKEVCYYPIYRNNGGLSGLPIAEKIPILDHVRKAKEFYYHPLHKTGYDLIHCYNGICNTKVPWITTFETTLPRILSVDCKKVVVRMMEQFYYRLLAKENCKHIYALSKAAFDMQEMRLRNEYEGKYYDAIHSKMSVLHPPQKANMTPEEIADKYFAEISAIEFIIVGGGFFYKGGKEAVEALAYYVKSVPLHLTIISNFFSNPAVEPGYTKEDYRSCMKVIRENKKWITVYNSLPNLQVLKLVKKAHVMLFPSYGDTYGFACLEAQASGCPVVTTDQRAFPEINDDDCGWIFPIEGNTNKEKQDNNRQQLIRIIGDILEHPEQLQGKAQRGLERVCTEHDPQQHADILLHEYKNAL